MIAAIRFTKRDGARYRVIIAELTHMSRDGWRTAHCDDYLPLERELAILAAKRRAAREAARKAR